MKVREVIEINRTLTLQELYDFMQQHWDRERYNDFVLGGPAAGTFRDYIMLPATQRCVICVYPRKDKIIAAVMPNSEGQMTLAGSLVLHGYGRMGMTGEMRGVAARANTLYASYLEKLLEQAGMLSDSPKRECPVVARTNTDGDAGERVRSCKNRTSRVTHGFKSIVSSGFYLRDSVLHRYTGVDAGSGCHTCCQFRAA
ncbi:MAG: hypothetical protein ACTTKS_00610 [Bulleidia sp.]